MYSSHHSTWALNLREELDDRGSQLRRKLRESRGNIPKFHGEFVGIEAGVVFSVTEIGKGYRFLFKEPRETCCLFRGTEER